MLQFEHVFVCVLLDVEKPQHKTLRVQRINQKVVNIFQEQLEKEIVNCESDIYLEAALYGIQKAARRVVISASNLNQKVNKNWWVSAVPTELIVARKLIPSGSEYGEEQRKIKSGFIKSLRNDCDQWWLGGSGKMEKAAVIGNGIQLFRLIKKTCIKNPSVGETISVTDEDITHSQSRRLNRWAKQFN